MSDPEQSKRKKKREKAGVELPISVPVALIAAAGITWAAKTYWDSTVREEGERGDFLRKIERPEAIEDYDYDNNRTIGVGNNSVAKVKVINSRESVAIKMTYLSKWREAKREWCISEQIHNSEMSDEAKSHFVKFDRIIYARKFEKIWMVMPLAVCDLAQLVRNRVQQMPLLSNLPAFARVYNNTSIPLDEEHLKVIEHFDELLGYFKILLKALKELHERARIVHQDIKPANILVFGKGHVKFADYGFSCWQPNRNLDGCGMRVGTPTYVDPEVAEHAKQDVVTSRSDVYSFGMTFIHMFLGLKPNPSYKQLKDLEIFNQSLQNVLAGFTLNRHRVPLDSAETRQHISTVESALRGRGVR